MNYYLQVSVLKFRNKLGCYIIKEDPDDDKFIECANEVNADYVISWDKHLLNIKEFKEIKIINPTNFLKEFK